MNVTKTDKKKIKPAGLDRITSYFTKVKNNADTCSKALGRWTKVLKDKNPEAKSSLDELQKCAADAIECATDAFALVNTLKTMDFKPPVQRVVKPIAGCVVVKSEFVDKYTGVAVGEELRVLEEGPRHSAGVFVQTQDNTRLFVAKAHLVQPEAPVASA